ncbi:MAG: endonuclease III [Holophaga sp.]|nr:endonuclease III [Holophaga sp.]
MAPKAPPVAALLDRLAKAYPDARCALDHRDPYQLVVATVLSAQCTDARVNVTTPAFFQRFPDPASLAAGDPAEVEALIRSTGFFRNKAKNLQGMALALLERHGGQVPATREDLARLPGVGPKTANVVLANAFGVPALAVDTHIYRVARRLGLSTGTTPDRVEADLCRLFPAERWIELHHQFIFHGRRVCHARKPDCLPCPLRDLCPTGRGDIPDPHTGQALVAAALEPEAKAVLPGPPAAGPARIVSLVPSVTELLAQWGLASRLAGRTAFCVEPKWIRASVPSVGGTKNPDLERIIALRPDLVILEEDENTLPTAEALRAAGLRLLVLRIRSVKDCLEAFRQLGDGVGLPDLGRARAAELKAELKARPAKGPRTLAVIWKDPWMSAGPGTYVADLIRQAGMTPIGPDRYPTLTEAQLEALDPELILLPDEPYRFTARHQAELQRRFPGAAVRRLDGRHLTWYLSRTRDGLQFLRNFSISAGF